MQNIDEKDNVFQQRILYIERCPSMFQIIFEL